MPIVPAGTFVAKARNGAIQFPKPIGEYCKAVGWDLFRVTPLDDWRLELRASDEDFHCSLSPDGVLWIPEHLRSAVALGEQSVMMRVEDGVIHVYLRKVFETLGFRP